MDAQAIRALTMRSGGPAIIGKCGIDDLDPSRGGLLPLEVAVMSVGPGVKL
jgi:hypothetical protein